LVGCATTEPEIPSCSACEFKQALLGKGNAKGDFSTVDTTVFKEARVILNGAIGSATVPVPLPTGGSYTSPQVSFSGTGKLNNAVMEFRYKTSFGDLRWASKNINLPVTSPLSGPFATTSIPRS
jgi:hypothetical protein